MKGNKTNKEIHALKTQFGMWLGLSDKAKLESGLPVDQKAFADEHEIHLVTLSTWKKDKTVREARENSLTLFAGRYLFGAIDRMGKNAVRDNARDASIRLYLEYMGRLDKRSQGKEVKETHEVKIVIEQPTRQPDRSKNKATLPTTEEVSGKPD